MQSRLHWVTLHAHQTSDDQGVGRLDIALVYGDSNYEEYNSRQATEDSIVVAGHSSILSDPLDLALTPLHLQKEEEKRRAKEGRFLKQLLVHEKYRDWFTSLAKWRQTAPVNEVYTFPTTLTAFDRQVII